MRITSFFRFFTEFLFQTSRRELRISAIYHYLCPILINMILKYMERIRMDMLIFQL